MSLNVGSVTRAASKELRRSLRKRKKPLASAHEGLGYLLEEIRELETEVFTRESKRNRNRMRKEAIQVAAMALRFALECCDE